MADLRTDVRATILQVTQGKVTAADLDTAGGDLTAAGVDSLLLLSLIEALETTFGIVIDPTESPDFLMTESRITAFVAGHLGVAVDA
jgi:acyl carrier protein